MKKLCETGKIPMMMKKHCFLVLILSVAALFGGCGLDQKEVLMTDRSYRTTVLGTNEDVSTVPDGILWKHGNCIWRTKALGDARLGRARRTSKLCRTRASDFRRPKIW
jgi:hypothetical protein